MELSSYQQAPLRKINLATLPAVWHRYTKEEVESEIYACGGIVTLICNKLDCSYTQFYNCLEKYQLQDALKQAKQIMLGQAEEVLVKSLQSSNEQIALKAAETVLKSRFAAEQGWGSGPQVNIAQQIVSDSDKALQIRNIFGIQDVSRSPGGEAAGEIGTQGADSSGSAPGAATASGGDTGAESGNAVP